ncbi:MAG: phosphotransferase family protein [Chloroflexota bacterium]
MTETTHFLERKYDGRVADVSSIAGGAWSDAFSFVHDASRYVLRWSDHAENFERDAIASTYRRDGLPVPEILELGRESGHYYAISLFVDGEFFEELPAPALEASLDSILGMFAALRSVDLSGRRGFGTWDGTGNGQYDSWREFLLDINNDPPGSLIEGWSDNLAASTPGFAAFDRLYERLEAAVGSCPEHRQLIHSDLINRNVLVRDGKVTAVLDWGSSNYGDALYDIAWISFFEPWHPALQSVDLPARLLEAYRSDPASDTANLQGRLACYYIHIGLDWISYNAFRRDWNMVDVAIDYSERLISEYA